MAAQFTVPAAVTSTWGHCFTLTRGPRVSGRVPPPAHTSPREVLAPVLALPAGQTGVQVRTLPWFGSAVAGGSPFLSEGKDGKVWGQ